MPNKKKAGYTYCNFRVPRDLKLEAEKYINCFELNMTQSYIIFLKMVVLHKGLPFKLNISDEMAYKGSFVYKDIKEPGEKTASPSPKVNKYPGVSKDMRDLPAQDRKTLITTLVNEKGGTDAK